MRQKKTRAPTPTRPDPHYHEPDYSKIDALNFGNTSRKINCSFRVYIGQNDLIQAAAYRHNISAASYMRQVVLETAAWELGVPVPDYAGLESDVGVKIAALARAQGLTTHELERRIAEEKLRTSQEEAERVLSRFSKPRVTPFRKR
jgi:hypothetical protein